VTAIADSASAAASPAGGDQFNAAGWLLGRHAAETPGRVAVTAVDAAGQATDLTYRDLDELAWQAAAALIAAGLRADVFKADGVWVSPTEVETRLRAHPAVEQAVVVAVLDSDGLEKPVACVIPRPGSAPTAGELIGFCRAGLAAYKRPRHVLFLPEFPLTATGKVQRFRLREYAIAQVAASQAASAGSPLSTSGRG